MDFYRSNRHNHARHLYEYGHREALNNEAYLLKRQASIENA